LGASDVGIVHGDFGGGNMYVSAVTEGKVLVTASTLQAMKNWAENCLMYPINFCEVFSVFINLLAPDFYI
jgi:hypothetical protein